MRKLKRITVLSFTKLQAVMMAIAGFIAGTVYAFGGATYDVLVSASVLSSSSTPGVGYDTALAFLALIGMPIIFAGCGFIVGLIEAILYNAFARWSGGIEVDFE